MLLRIAGGGVVRCNGLFDNGRSPQGFPNLSQRIVGGHRRARPDSWLSSSSRWNLCPIPPARQDFAFHPRSILRETNSVQEQIGLDRFVPLVERFAVQRRGRRTSGSLMLLQFPCGDCVRCNGLFDGRTTNPRNFSEEADSILRRRRDSTTSATPATPTVHREPASPG